jgi:hypothetical protein
MHRRKKAKILNEKETGIVSPFADKKGGQSIVSP